MGTIASSRTICSKGISRLIPLLVPALILSGCLCQQPAYGRGGLEEGEAPVRKQNEHPLPGGFSDIPVDEPTALDAYEFLKAELRSTHPEIRLGPVQRAARQVVAGTNIRLVCSYSLDDEAMGRKLTAIVYIDLKGNRSLRSLELDTDPTE